MKNTAILLLIFFSLSGYSQNLVPNPSFETYTVCPQGPGSFGTDVPPWSTPDTATPDYYNVCYTPIFPGAPSMDVPSNIQGSQNARTGVGYAGFIASEQSFGFNTDYREYCQVQLTSPLSAGQTYCVEFYWNLAGNSMYYVEEMGVYFSNTVTNLLQSTTLPFTPQVSVSGTPLNDTTNWVLFQQNYTAIGGEEFIIIGNFNNPGSTTSGATGMPSNISLGGDFAYYYLEDVSVSLGNCVVPCDATINSAGPFCDTDASVTLTSLFPGGTWTGDGVTNASSGVFDPGVSGAGTHTITYTLPCGDVQITSITVSTCTALTGCLESNGDITVSGGLGPYSWQSQSTFTDCSGCFGGTCVPFVCDGVVAPNWIDNGITVADPGAGLYPIEVTDANGTTLVITSSGSLTSCSATCTPPTLSDTQIDVTCIGGNDGSIDLTVTGTSTYGFAWSNTATTEDINGLVAGTYSVTVTDLVDGTCTATASVTIIDGAQPTVVANASFTTICQGDPVTLTGGGASTYTWTGVITPTDGVPFIPAATDTYTVTGVDGSGCTNTDQITVTVNNCTVPTASFVASNTALCESDCINFTDQSTGTNINTWAWSFPGATTTTSTDQNPTNICYPTAGTYDVTLVVTDANGTDDSTIVSYITVNNCAQPIASFSVFTTALCEADCINFSDQSTGTNISAWAWSFPGALTTTSSFQNPASICYPTAGTYAVTLTVTDDNGTDDSTMTNYITVTNCSTPTAAFSASSTSICQGDCITYTDQSTGTVGTVTYSWSFPGSATSTSALQNPTNICYSAAGTYNVTLTITDDNGTDVSSMTNYITVSNCTTPTANFVISSSEICLGECIDFTDFSTGGATSWEWTFAGGSPSTSTDQNPTGVCFLTDGSMDITLVALNSQGSDTLTQTIIVNPSPTVDAGPDVTINAGVSTTLEAIGSEGTFVWSPDSALSCTFCEITDASPEYTTTYIVTVTDANGCSAFDDVEVATIFIEGIGVPSAFSPNGDDRNDILYVEGAGIVELEFIVYNRYGQKVFESFDKNVGWDGSLNGKPENPGVFAYVAIYKLIGGGEGVLKGDVTLIK